MHFLVSESFYGNTAPPKKEIDWTYVRDKMQGLRNPQENLQKAHILQKYKKKTNLMLPFAKAYMDMSITDMALMP